MSSPNKKTRIKIYYFLNYQNFSSDFCLNCYLITVNYDLTSIFKDQSVVSAFLQKSWYYEIVCIGCALFVCTLYYIDNF